MKITVRDVTNNEVNVRDYMRYDEETGNIYVAWEHLDTVLIDKTEEWERLKKQNKRYQKALELIKLKTLDIKGDKDTRPFQIYGIASEALEGDEE